jgi:hypothetical protein
MPKLLHEQTGLRIVKNDINQFAVITLHFTADPAKRSPQWEAEAKAGMPPAKWEKEYCISYTALFGERVFPELVSNRNKIIVSEPYPELPEDLPCWGGFDYGARNPTSFHVYTIHDNVVYSIWELYEPCKNIVDFVTKMKGCPYWSRLKYIAADPSIWNRTQQMASGLTSIYHLFTQAGVPHLIKGNNDETAWMAQMREHWRDNAEDPTFRIFARCPNQIREFDSAVFVSMSEKQLHSQNYKEAINDHNNHSLDDCKYFMNSRPKYQQTRWKSPTMVKRWVK